jgi:hypothetical protein
MLSTTTSTPGGGLLLVMAYLSLLAAPWALTRLGLVKPSRLGPAMDRQLRLVLLYVGLLVLPFLLDRWGLP